MSRGAHAEHFADLEQQAHAARLGMWVFLASELLLFAGLFTVYFFYRALWLEAFRAASHHTLAWNGALGTAVLLTASLCAALAVTFAERDRVRAACAVLTGAAGLGLVFLGFKIYEYVDHVEHELVPGRVASPDPGADAFWTLYYATTGLHAVHVLVGVAVLGAAAGWAAWRGRLSDRAYVVENCANYWHLVDVIWLFVWPMFYLMRGGA